ncbi:MAG: SPOR domain-containing protein [Acetobacteraceae bacterium]
MSDDLPLRTPSYRPPRQPGMDPATRRLALIAAGLGAALLVVIGLWSVTSGPSGGTVPVIAPPAGPLRVPPPAGAGVHVAGANQPIFNQGATPGNGGSAVLPGPERPDLAALRAPPPPPPPAAPVGAPAAAPVAAPAAAPAPAPGPAAVLPTPPAFRAPPPREAAAPVAAASPAAGPGGGVSVQLAALPTRAAALSEWQTLRQRYPGLLGRRRLVISRARVNGRIWFRVRTGGLASRAAAAGLCAQLRAAGAACDVPRP